MSIFKAGLSMRDSYGRVTTPSFQLEATDITDAQAKLQLFVDDYAAIVGSDVTHFWIHLDTNQVDTPSLFSNKDEGATFKVAMVIPQQNASVKLKSPEKAIFAADGTVDLTNALVIAWFSHYASGVFLLSDGQVADSLTSGTLDQ